MKLESKQQIAQALHTKFSDATLVVATEYKGLNVAALNELRKALKDQGMEYQVVKNSLIVRAAEDTDVALIRETFKGPTAVAVASNDPVNSAKALVNFMKDHDKLVIRNGVMQGKVLTAEDIKTLSKMPSKEVLLGQLLGTMNAVPQGFVRVLAAVPTGLVNVLNNIKEQKEQQAA